MRKWMGTLFLLLGVVCIMASLGFVIYNRFENKSAESFSKSMLEELKGVIITDNNVRNDPIEVHYEKTMQEMITVEVDGYDCIGILSIPALELELPVLADWSYEKLKKAPCHYYGSCYEKDFVIAAHNYRSHFGRLSELQPGDKIIFTDAKGIVYYYEVALLETLPKKATEEMIASGFDLSLYTCTLGGDSRVTVRCNVVDGVN